MKFIETIRMQDNIPINIQYHIDRLKENSQVQLPLLSSLNTIKNGRVKCRIVYDEMNICSVEFVAYCLPKINSLKLICGESLIYNKKFLDRSQLDALFKKRQGCDDVIICRNGFLGDSYFCNIVLEDMNGKLFVPSDSILLGTKVRSLLDANLVSSKRIHISDLKNYKGIYLVNAMIDLEDGVYVLSKNVL